MNALGKIEMAPHKGVVSPHEGWKPNTLYTVELCCGSNNPIFTGVLFTGFLSGDRGPGSYSTVLCSTGDTIPVSRAYYLRVHKELPKELQVFRG